MGIVRPVMGSHPWAWAFFVPFIVIATFTILNLFIGIIVSTMQELGTAGFEERTVAMPEVVATLQRLEGELRSLRGQLEAGPKVNPPDELTRPSTALERPCAPG